MWDVHLTAQHGLAKQFLRRGNWGGFLAANHKVWCAMHERGIVATFV
jgi:hypothetical protein